MNKNSFRCSSPQNLALPNFLYPLYPADIRGAFSPLYNVYLRGATRFSQPVVRLFDRCRLLTGHAGPDSPPAPAWHLWQSTVAPAARTSGSAIAAVHNLHAASLILTAPQAGGTPGKVYAATNPLNARFPSTHSSSSDKIRIAKVKLVTCL